MNLLSVNNLSKSYGSKTLFQNISFGIQHGEKVALVARNGAGKTTLFNILKGKEIADEGEVVFRKNLRIAFLDQDFSLDELQSVEEIIFGADNEFVKCIKEYEAALLASEHNHSIEISERLEEALRQMNEKNVWEYEKNFKEILSRLEINNVKQKIETLSGGQRKRVALALVLINKPDLIFMDEPTNHLDIEMIEWLENFLSRENLSLLLVTHDRYFLDEVCDRILELEDGNLFEYKGNFEYYLQKKSERESQRTAEIDKARNLYRRELEWIRKMPKARGTKAKARVDAFDELKERAKQKRGDKKIELSVKMERMGSKIVELHRVTKKFGDKIILNPFTYTFKSGEKIGVVGKNGVGKSTLLNMILGKEQISSGKIQAGDTIKFGYYSQGGLKINEDKRILELVKERAEFIPMANGTHLSASQLLTQFNFPPDVQYSFVSTLSGGEKRRLYLLTILIENPNFLILDEPTNDLDIVTLQILEEFLEEFKGCVLIVSHDRHFMDRLAHHIFVFEGNGELKDFPGNYTDYRIWKQEEGKKQNESEISPKSNTKETIEKVNQNTKTKKLSYHLHKELAELDKEIPELEKKKNDLEIELSSGITDYSKVYKLNSDLFLVSQELEQKTLRWFEIQELNV